MATTDSGLTNAIKSLQKSQDVTTKGVAATASGVEGLNDKFNSFFDYLKMQDMKALDVADRTATRPSPAEKIGDAAMDLSGLFKMLQGFGITLAGAGVLSNLGFIGMKDLKASIGMPKILRLAGERITAGIRAARNWITWKLGWTDPEGNKLSGKWQDPDTGRFMKNPLTRIQEGWKNVRSNVGRIFQPISDLFEKVRTFFRTGATTLLDDLMRLPLIGRILSGGKAILNSVVLRVAAYVMSIYDGVMEAIFGVKKAEEAEEGTTAEVLRGALGFVGGATASFFGGFMDLIKLAVKGIVWSVAKLFFGDSWNEDGTYNEATFLGSFMKGLDEFSFIDTILNFFRMVQDAVVGWVADATEAVTNFLEDPLGSIGGFIGPNEDDPAYQEKVKKQDELNAKLEERRQEYLRQVEEFERLRAERQNAVGGNINIDASTNSSSNQSVNMGNQQEDPKAKRETRTKGGG